VANTTDIASSCTEPTERSEQLMFYWKYTVFDLDHHCPHCIDLLLDVFC